MISVGEESNSLDTVLPDIAEFAREDNLPTSRFVRATTRTDHAASDGNSGTRSRSRATGARAKKQHDAVTLLGRHAHEVSRWP